MSWDWRRVAPEEAGFEADLGARLEAAAGRPEFANLHGVVVARGETIVLEGYFSGEDECWGRPLGTVAFEAETLHDLRSVSKSIVGLLYGIALDEGIVPPLDQPLVDAFPDCADIAADPARRALTVEHAMTMTLGIEWDESLSYADPRNAERLMEAADDRYRFILERPIVAPPGAEWNYCGGATAILAHLIARGAGRALLDYARDRLFGPLGIEDVTWTAGTNGEAAAASGLRMRPRDLARIGRLVNAGGRWGEKKIVPAAWVEAMLTPRVRPDETIEYGYQWWIGRLPSSGRPWHGAFGNGGQRLMAAPGLDLVIAVTAGNYNSLDAWRVPVGVSTEVVFPALRE